MGWACVGRHYKDAKASARAVRRRRSVLVMTTMATTTAATAPLTEAQARDWLADHGNDGMSVRQLAKLWGWNPTKVYRFLPHVRNGGDETLDETPGVSS